MFVFLVPILNKESCFHTIFTNFLPYFIIDIMFCVFHVPKVVTFNFSGCQFGCYKSLIWPQHGFERKALFVSHVTECSTLKMTKAL